MAAECPARVTADAASILFSLTQEGATATPQRHCKCRKWSGPGLPLEVSLVNLQEVLDPLDILRKLTGIRIQDMYNKMLRNRWTLGSPQLMRVLQLVVRTYHGRCCAGPRTVLERAPCGHGGFAGVPHFNQAFRESYERFGCSRPFVTGSD